MLNYLWVKSTLNKFQFQFQRGRGFLVLFLLIVWQGHLSSLDYTFSNRQRDSTSNETTFWETTLTLWVSTTWRQWSLTILYFNLSDFTVSNSPEELIFTRQNLRAGNNASEMVSTRALGRLSILENNATQGYITMVSKPAARHSGAAEKTRETSRGKRKQVVGIRNRYTRGNTYAKYAETSTNHNKHVR